MCDLSTVERLRSSRIAIRLAGDLVRPHLELRDGVFEVGDQLVVGHGGAPCCTRGVVVAERLSRFGDASRAAGGKFGELGLIDGCSVDDGGGLVRADGVERAEQITGERTQVRAVADA